jgi:hypothetical protein
VAVTRDRPRLAAVVLAAGLGLAGLAQLMASPHTAPLFDGVFVEDPYRFVEPPPGAAGDPLRVEVTEPVVGGAVPLVAVATGEVPPQAQLIAQADAFAIPAATTSIIVSIQPAAAPDPQVSGNVYSLRVTDQAGTLLQLRPETLVTIVLRSPDARFVTEVARFDGATWVALPTEHGGLPDLFSANIAEIGDFALVLTGAVATSSAQPSNRAATGTPVPSEGSDGTASGADGPNWVVILFVVGAIGVGLAWGVLGGGERR